MISKFKQLFESLLVSEAKKEKERIKDAIKDIKNVYGENAASEITRLLDIVNKYSKELNKLKGANLLNPPKKPTPPKSNKLVDVEKYKIKLQKYKILFSDYWKKLREFNNKKLKEISTISQKASNYNVPDDGSCQLEYVNGNSKVGDDTIIINMGPANSCSAAKADQCELYSAGWCYAQNNETQHKLAIVKRFREQLQWETDKNGSVIAAQLASVIISKRKRGTNIEYVRFNESGDMKNLRDKEKLGNVVKETNNILLDNKESPIIFYTYTHRSDLFPKKVNDIDDSKYLVIQGSGFFKGSRSSKNTPFYVDNCFMGIDYPNLLDLVRNGNLDQLTKKEDDEHTGNLGIDFGDTRPTIMICKGACKGCQWCKTKGHRYLILVVYHGSGSKYKTAGGQLTTKIGKVLDKYNLSPEIKRELYNTSHFNEYILADKLIGYVKTRKFILWSDIIPLILDIRDITEQDEKEAIKQWKASGGTGFRPRISSVGTKFSTLKELTDYISDAQLKASKSKANVDDMDNLDDDFDESTKFDKFCKDIMISETNTAHTNIPPLSEMSIRDIQNLAVANTLVNHKDFVSVDTIKKLLTHANIDVM